MLLFVLMFIVALWLLVPLFWPRRELGLNRIKSSTEAFTANYFIAGLLNQPEPAFRFLTGEINSVKENSDFADEDLVMVSYKNGSVSFRKTCRTIERDIALNGYTKVRFFGISIGTKIGHYFSEKCRLQTNSARCYVEEIDSAGVEVECYDINPCWSPKFLKPKLRIALRLGIIPLSLIELLLGPLGFIPLIKQSGEWFSVKLFVSELRHIAFSAPKFLTVEPNDAHEDIYASDGDITEPSTKIVVLSDMDEFLDNNVVIEHYDTGVKKVFIETHHGDTIGAGYIYREALDAQLHEKVR